jgi:hypothetical protein
MTSAVIKIIIGLFIWMVVPQLIFQKKTKKKAPYRRFATVVCAIIGILIAVLGAVDLVRLLIGI